MPETILENMFLTFISCVENMGDRALLVRNYERQRENYRLIFSDGDNESNEQRLVCARCIISATRSLFYDEYSDITRIKGDIEFLKPFFKSERKKTSEFEPILNARMQKLTKMGSDSVSDAVLFMYISLMSQDAKEKSLERCFL